MITTEYKVSHTVCAPPSEKSDATIINPQKMNTIMLSAENVTTRLCLITLMAYEIAVIAISQIRIRLDTPRYPRKGVAAMVITTPVSVVEKTSTMTIIASTAHSRYDEWRK